MSSFLSNLLLVVYFSLQNKKDFVVRIVKHDDFKVLLKNYKKDVKRVTDFVVIS